MTDSPVSRLPLDEERIAGAAVPGVRVEVVAQAPSTNALVAARAQAGEPDGLVVVAEHQTAGRGRLDRTWETPPRAALTFSVLVRADVPPDRWPWLPLLTGAAVCAGIRAANGPLCFLKWPNDVLHEGRKLGGILAERIQTGTGSAGVVGVGLNVSQAPEELPVPTAASLLTEGHPRVDRSDLLVAVLRELEPRLVSWRRGEEPGLRAEYLRWLDTLGKTVRVQLPDGASLEGVAVGVSAHGALEVQTPEGTRSVNAGDVVHVRPV